MEKSTEKILWYIAIIVGIIFFLAFIGGGIGLYVSTNNKKKENEINKKHQEQLSMAIAESSKCPGPIQLEGKTGPEGPQGPSGGIYSQSGPLRNLSNTNLVADRFDCFGNSALAYLSEQNYKPQQTWTLKSSENNMGGVLQNQYGGCLTVDEINNVHMTTPVGCKNASKWIFTAQGQLKPTKDKKKCLGFTNAGILKNVQKKQPICSKGSINPTSNLMKLQLVDCENQPTTEQQWAFH